MSKKILELIPESLRENLISEVKEHLQEKGFTILNPEDEGSGPDNKKTDAKSIDADIADWAGKKEK